MPIYNLNTNENSGGFLRLEIYKITDVLNCPNIITEFNVGAISFKNSADAINIYPVGDTITVKESNKETDAGVEYSIRAGLTAKYQNKPLDNYLTELFNVPVVLVAVKRDDSKKIYGSVQYPLRFDFEPINGKALDEDKGFKMRVRGKTPQKPIYM